VLVYFSASDIKDLRIVKDAHAARMSHRTTNVHVKQHSGNESSNKSLQDQAKADCQEQLANGFKAVVINQNEGCSLSSSLPAVLSHSPMAKKKTSKGESSSADHAHAAPADDGKKNSMHSVNGPTCRQSPNRRTCDAGDNDATRLQPVSKSNGGRLKTSQTMSPVNNVNGASQSGVGYLGHNDDGDYQAASRKRTTSGVYLHLYCPLAFLSVSTLT
jgi:hypothetical protein